MSMHKNIGLARYQGIFGLRPQLQSTEQNVRLTKNTIPVPLQESGWLMCNADQYS